MVRPRLQLERLEGNLSRDHYYLHNKSTVIKKVKEMSILTGSDVLFFAFSPRGIPALHLGQGSNFMNIMRRFSEIPNNDREKRRHDNLQTLKANYQKEGYNIEVETLYDAWKVKRLEAMKENLKKLKQELSDKTQRLRYYENPKRINSIEMANELLASLKRSLEGVRKRKAELLAQNMTTSQAPVEPAVEYIPEMLSGNDDILAYANILRSGNSQASTS